jgi:peptide/nickel transport system substrate-binding protein
MNKICKRFNRRHAAASLMCCLSLYATAASAIDDKPAIDRDTVVFGVGKPIANLDGQVAATGDSQRYGWLIYDTLYAFDAKGKMQPWVATGVDISDDGLSYTFSLRNDVRFHNGALLTSVDVKYSMERILDPVTKSTRRPYFANLVNRVDTDGDSKVTFHLKNADGAFLNKIAGFLLLVPKDYTESLKSPEDFARAPVGSGPYRFVKQDIGRSVELARFDQYWGAKPGIKHLIFKLIPEPSSRINAIVRGEADIVDYVPGADVKRLKERKGLSVVSAPVGSPLAVRLYSKVADSPLARRDVRLALNYGLDTKALIDSVLHGIGKPLSSYISSVYPYGVDPELKPYEYDPAKARKLLASGGYPNGFKTELLCPTDQPKELCEAISAYWSQIGVQATVKVIDYAAWGRLNNTHKSGPMTIMQMSNAIYDPIHPISGAATEAGSWSDYSNPEVEKLVKQYGAETDQGKRDEAFRKIGKLLKEDGHSVLLTELYYTFAMDSGLQWTPQFGSGYYNLRNIRWK